MLVDHALLSRLAKVADASMLERLLQLDNPAGVHAQFDMPPPSANTPIDFDVILMGGGLSVLLAPLLAKAGLSVAVIERSQAALAHREWNCSWQELQALVEVGLCTPQELEQLVVARYTHGICRWYGGHTHSVTGVLDCAVDAGMLLRIAYDKALAYGVHFFNHSTVLSLCANEHCVGLTVQRGEQQIIYHALAVLDGRGSASPYATADLVCPTVGGVMEGLLVGDAPDCMQPHIGDILVTTEDIEQGRQYIWEAFPGAAGQTTVYLFYYAKRQSVSAGALQALYARFFARLASYKKGPARLVRPTFGYISGWSRLTPPPRAPHWRVVLVGDAAARHSPLTFCGFGAMLRSLGSVTQHVQNICTADSAKNRSHVAVDDRVLHRLTGALSLMMSQPLDPNMPPNGLNRLLDIAFGTLASMGNHTFADLLQDTMSVPDFMRFMWRVGLQYPQVYGAMWRTLGPRQLLRWSMGFYSFAK